MQNKICSQLSWFIIVVQCWKSSKPLEYNIQKMISDWLCPSPSRNLMHTCTATMHRKKSYGAIQHTQSVRPRRNKGLLLIQRNGQQLQNSFHKKQSRALSVKDRFFYYFSVAFSRAKIYCEYSYVAFICIICYSSSFNHSNKKSL